MSTYYAKKILLQDGWNNDIYFEVNHGLINNISQKKPPKDKISKHLDIVIPGLCNAHSHSFQRALSGHTEHIMGKSEDNFWTWRKKMYQLVDNLDISALSAIVCQAYKEMISRGYTQVVEFHYIHRDDDQKDINNKIFRSILKAAKETGINLIYTPILYQRGGFLDEELSIQQKKFYSTIGDFLDHYEYAKSLIENPHKIAIGIHSLRAVNEKSLRKIADFKEKENIPIHMHIAEQKIEVSEFSKLYGTRPVEWLINNFSVDESWCLVHATHINNREVETLAKSNATVCICPTTEANLGDGIFRLKDYIQHKGTFAIGSDSNISIDPFEELRWLEYSQRLVNYERNISSKDNIGCGQFLFNETLKGGANASGYNNLGQLADGSSANLLEISSSNPSLAGHSNKTLLDAIVFSNQNSLIAQTMINGEWIDNSDSAGKTLIFNNALEKIFTPEESNAK